MANEIKIFKKSGIAIGLEINGKRLEGVTGVKINNDYTSNETHESVTVKISDISSLEIISD